MTGSEPDTACRVAVAAGHWAADCPAEKAADDERHDDDHGGYGEEQGWAGLHGETLNHIGDISNGNRSAKSGASTGTNLWGALQVAKGMMERGERGSIVTLMCDSGERYLNTYYNAEWVSREIGDLSAPAGELGAWL